MISFLVSLLGWLPSTLKVIALGVVTIFVIVSVLRLVNFILELIPFL